MTTEKQANIWKKEAERPAEINRAANPSAPKKKKAKPKNPSALHFLREKKSADTFQSAEMSSWASPYAGAGADIGGSIQRAALSSSRENSSKVRERRRQTASSSLFT